MKIMKKHLSITNFFLKTIGAIGIIVSLGYDFFRLSEPDFGRKQFMGFIGSVMILIAGLKKPSGTKNTFQDFVSLFIYIAGMFYLVLVPHHYHHHHANSVMLGLAGFSMVDFCLNVIGFMPLGYLLMSLLSQFTAKYKQTMTLIVVFLTGVLLSFLIEISQHYIPGRTSSLIDVAANGLGTLSGILIFLIHRAYTQKRIKECSKT